MLPAPLQLPAALVLVAGGLMACCAGHRLFRAVLAVYGFILGALIASSLAGVSDTTSMVIAVTVGGLLGAVILIVAYFIGVALIGATGGALLANVIWAQLGTDPHPMIVIGFSIAGALLALALQRYVIILGTAFGGAWTAIVGGVALTGSRAAVAASEKTDAWLVYPFNPAPGQRFVYPVWLLLGILGAVTQFAFTARGRK